jgi:DNA polymerase V
MMLILKSGSISLMLELISLASLPSQQTVPLFMESISAGFPSPADDHQDGNLDFNQYLIQHPAATFCLRVSGDSMIGASIHSGDLLIVDRSLEPLPGRIVVAAVNGELTVKRLMRQSGQMVLMAENPNYPPIPLRQDVDSCTVWGVVTYVIHKT